MTFQLVSGFKFYVTVAEEFAKKFKNFSVSTEYAVFSLRYFESIHGSSTNVLIADDKGELQWVHSSHVRVSTGVL